MKNFAYLADKFVQAGAARVVTDKDDVLEMFLIRDADSLKKMGDRAKETLHSLRGATEKTVKAIEFMMGGSKTL